MNMKILLISLLISVMIFCSIVNAGTTTVSGTLGSSAEINNLSTAQSLGLATVNVEQISTFDPFDVNANSNWTIQVYGAKMVSDIPSDTATNSLKLYYNNVNGDNPTSSANLPASSGTTQFSGVSGPTQARALKFGQTFTWDDKATGTGGNYTSVVNVDIAPTA